MSATDLAKSEASWPSFVDYEQFILFGDSITQGSGNQEKGFAFAPALQQEKEKVRLMTVFFGANDAVLPGFHQHVPLNVYEDSLTKILTHPVVQAHGTKLLLLTPPPVNEYQFFTHGPEPEPVSLQRRAAQTKLYADAARRVGQALNVPVVDIWTAFMTAVGWTEGDPLAGSKEAAPNEKLEALLSDGLHFNPPGYRIMYEEVIKVIRECYPELAPEEVPMNFPPWDSAPKR
ncbi:hypothetical protein FQN53_008889 [Emmonsiellopsis sp. PD_33]|nr:hypothetical protein FQN53_008889 [Emmonsiellopsis sp. PD_33]KAK2807419.1 hypothetical protein FQN51_003246 [Onygenales sp. PD_10]